MTFPTDWDVERYHVEHESEEHWELRKRFLLEHKDKFPEERLVCLAQVFYNVEFYGCRYPEKTMRLVAELSEGVANEHREKMKTKLQRTFVQASDAAITKAKGRSHNESTAPKMFKPINFQKTTQEATQESMDIIDITQENSQETEQIEDNNPVIYQEQSENKDQSKKKKKKRNKKKKQALETNIDTDAQPETQETFESMDIVDLTENNSQEIEFIEHANQDKKGLKSEKPKKKSGGKRKEKITSAEEKEIILAESTTSAKNKDRKRKRKITSAEEKEILLAESTIATKSDRKRRRTNTCAEGKEGLSPKSAISAKKNDRKMQKKNTSAEEIKILSPESTTSANIPGKFVLSNLSPLGKSCPRFEESNSSPAPSQKINSSSNTNFDKLILMDWPGASEYDVLARTRRAARIELKQEKKRTAEGDHQVTLTLGGHFLSQATAPTFTEALQLCSKDGLAILREQCYSIFWKEKYAGSVVDKVPVSVSANVGPSEQTPQHLAEDSKANRMMKLMGWGGKGLGKDQQGREQPVEVAQRVKRAGLGLHAVGQQFKIQMTELLKKFQESGASHDLIFASDFAKEERAELHLIANRLNLNNRTYGRGNDRHIVVGIRKTPVDLLKEVQAAGGSTDKYYVIPPRPQ